MSSSESDGPTPRGSVRFLDKRPAPTPAGPRRVRFVGSSSEGIEHGGRDLMEAAVRPGGPQEPCSSTVPELRYGLQSGASIRVIPSSALCQQVVAHCSESNSHGREIGGVLVGLRSAVVGPEGVPEYSVLVTDLIRVRQSSSSSSHVQFDHAFWDEVDQEMAARFAPHGKCRVGWYHTHPTQGIFFSGLDKDAHSIFRQPYQFAIVVDPRDMGAGLFYWQDSDRSRLGGPVRFSLQSGGSPPRSAGRISFGPRGGTNWIALVGAGVCVSLVLGGLLARGQRFSLVDAVVLGLTALLGYKVANPSLVAAAPSASASVHAKWRSALSMGALAVLTFWTGTRTSIPSPAESGVPRTAANTFSGQPPVSPGSDLPVGTAPIETPANMSAARTKNWKFAVQQSGKAAIRRVLVESPEPRASIVYQLARCRKLRSGLNINNCTVQVNRKREGEFIATVCSTGGQTGTECIKRLQKALGFEGGRVDGRWGPQTRSRFLREAIRMRSSSLGRESLVFERKSAMRSENQLVGLRPRNP